MRILLALYALALAVRLVLIGLFPDPAYPDSYYYVNVAHAIQAGRGFSIDFIWTFVDVGGKLPADPHLPIPSNAHWMPLASLVQVPFLSVLGSAAWVSALPFAIVGALAAPLTWLIAGEAGARQAVRLGAALLAAVPAALTVFVAQPDNFALYEVLGAGSLWLAARGLRGDSRAFALGGLLVGLATLARNDGVLLGLALAVTFFWDRWQAWRSGGRRPVRIPFWAGVACFVLFLVVMAPWYARQLATFGSMSPSSTSGRILLIRSFADMNSITAPANLSWFLGQGIGPLVTSRVLGFVAAIGVFTVVPCSVFLVPFVPIGGWLRRHSVDFGPYFAYAAILFGASGLLFAVHVPGGTFLHSAVALVPHAYILALEGVAASVAWVARRRKTWNVARAVPIFVGFAVALGIGSAALFGAGVLQTWSAERSNLRAAGSRLDALGVPQSTPVMAIDAGGIRYHTGHPSVVTPNDPLPVIETVAADYGVRWLVLERNSIVPALVPVLEGQSRPAWIGTPVLVIPSSASEATSASTRSATSAAASAPDLALYPVCTSAGDARCGTGSQ